MSVFVPGAVATAVAQLADCWWLGEHRGPPLAACARATPGAREAAGCRDFTPRLDLMNVMEAFAADGHLVAGLDVNRLDRTIGLGRHLHRRLVRAHLHQRLTGLHRVAGQRTPTATGAAHDPLAGVR